jgi:hypothetical protein
MEFLLSKGQSEEAKKWMEEHKNQGCTQEKSGAAGGTYSYMFTPTGLGIVEEVKCNLCNEQFTLTDFSGW